MHHSFDINIAQKFSVPVAIVLNHIAFWLIKNRANNKHFHDGRYWTYNSIPAFQELFPYWTYKQMRTILDKLKETGIVLTGNYNEKGYDQTLWYSFTDEGMKLFGIKTEPVDNIAPICPNGQMDKPKEADGCAKKGRPIPDIKPDIKTDKSFCFKGDQKANNEKKHTWAEKPKSPFSDPTKQSTSYKPPTQDTKPSEESVTQAMMSLPRHLRPARYRSAVG